MDYTLITATFRTLALEAGARIMEIYGRPDFEVMSKSDDSAVTEADLAADRVITAGLRAALPDIPVVTEEQSASHDMSADTFILVDPLDGTKEFVQRRGDFTVNIALIENGVPTRGVVYAPARMTSPRSDRPPASASRSPIRTPSSLSHPNRTAIRRPTITSPATRSPSSAPPVPRSSSASSRPARPTSIPVSDARWSGTRPRATPSCAARAAPSFVSTTIRP